MSRHERELIERKEESVGLGKKMGREGGMNGKKKGKPKVRGGKKKERQTGSLWV